MLDKSFLKINVEKEKCITSTSTSHYVHIILVQPSAVSCCYVICHRGPGPESGSGPNLAPTPELPACPDLLPRPHPQHPRSFTSGRVLASPNAHLSPLNCSLMMEESWTRKMFEQLPRSWSRSSQIFWEQREMKPAVARPIIRIITAI